LVVRKRSVETNVPRLQPGLQKKKVHHSVIRELEEMGKKKLWDKCDILWLSQAGGWLCGGGGGKEVIGRAWGMVLNGGGRGNRIKKKGNM